jgi:glycosyltransferase involved in cell wall biosynthesis
MTTSPRVLFGMPAYNRPDALPRTLESLLSQTYTDFALLIVDDRPSPEVRGIVETYMALDSRITYESNPLRLGMIGNWRKAFTRGREIHPGIEYFAWVSDHDVWHPRWLEVLIGELDGHSNVVMAYPQMQRMFPHERRSITRISQTAGMPSRVARMRTAIAEMTAGNGIYGLFRVATLEQAGVFRAVLMPDRQLLVELSLLGEFRHVSEILWYREVAGDFSIKRQRQMFFPGRPPLHTYLPPPVQHCGVLTWDLAVRGKGRPSIGRLVGAWWAACQLWYSIKREVLHDDAWWRSTFARWLPRRLSRDVAASSTASAAPDSRADVALEQK